MAGFMQAGRSARSEINIVPLIDVLLVLLIIFMVSAPLLSQRIGLDLPQAVPPNLLQPTPPTPPVLAAARDAGMIRIGFVDGD